MIKRMIRAYGLTKRYGDRTVVQDLDRGPAPSTPAGPPATTSWHWRTRTAPTRESCAPRRVSRRESPGGAAWTLHRRDT
ncbi:hypothetical protein [Streptomyces sp. cmx-18-6]|uniref:hypothetical protein n=1 Tax=Streptomyces sp. cmx-18-6 TaxID=2790930 RepID=UPI003980FD1F